MFLSQTSASSDLLHLMTSLLYFTLCVSSESSSDTDFCLVHFLLTPVSWVKVSPGKAQDLWLLQSLIVVTGVQHAHLECALFFEMSKTPGN